MDDSEPVDNADADMVCEGDMDVDWLAELLIDGDTEDDADAVGSAWGASRM